MFLIFLIQLLISDYNNSPYKGATQTKESSIINFNWLTFEIVIPQSKKQPENYKPEKDME